MHCLLDCLSKLKVKYRHTKMSSPYVHEESTKCSLPLVIKVLNIIILCECALSLLVTMLLWPRYCIVGEETCHVGVEGAGGERNWNSAVCVHFHSQSRAFLLHTVLCGQWEWNVTCRRMFRLTSSSASFAYCSIVPSCLMCRKGLVVLRGDSFCSSSAGFVISSLLVLLSGVARWVLVRTRCFFHRRSNTGGTSSTGKRTFVCWNLIKRRTMNRRCAWSWDDS